MKISIKLITLQNILFNDIIKEKLHVGSVAQVHDIDMSYHGRGLL